MVHLLQAGSKAEKMLALAEARGLRVIWSGPSGWEGRPDWWREDAPYEVCARDDLMAALETAWRGLGKAFRGHPALFAYELQNEPYAPSLPTPAMNRLWVQGLGTGLCAPGAPDHRRETCPNYGFTHFGLALCGACHRA